MNSTNLSTNTTPKSTMATMDGKSVVTRQEEEEVVCNPIRMSRWSELMVVCVCHSDEVMRDADANDTSGELGSAFPGILVDESVFSTAKMEC